MNNTINNKKCIKTEVFIGIQIKDFDNYYDNVTTDTNKPIHGLIQYKLAIQTTQNNKKKYIDATKKDPYVKYDINLVDRRNNIVFMYLHVHMHDENIFVFRHCKQDMLLFNDYKSSVIDLLFEVQNKEVFKIFNLILLFNEFLKRYGNIIGDKSPLFNNDNVKTNKKGYKVYAPSETKSKSLCKYVTKITEIKISSHCSLSRDLITPQHTILQPKSEKEELTEYEKSVINEYNEYNKDDGMFILETQLLFKNNTEKIMTELKIKIYYYCNY